ncbi:hypothetical protein ZEAMMB73_Zm00001d017810 [Zea mays]|uniref:Uncharacterized protein n=1 Tax=Zea mays TaxID=4577 RepID=A0A1D6HI16_MAIZE|nr:hypothetical protein ZEAMMB73_Zm00001d017810 [Zea mays]
MENHGKLDGWDEVLEEEDELASVCKYPISTSYLSYGTSRSMLSHFQHLSWGKSVKKPRFSLRGYDFVPLDVKTDNLCIGEQDGSSAVPSTKASQTMVAERLENVEEQTEDLAPEFALPPKANTLVSELLDNLQRRGGSFVRTPSLVCVVLHYFFILEFLHNTYITSEYFNLVAPTCSKHINQGAGSFIRSATN